MSSFVVSGRIQMEAEAARKEVQSFSGSLDSAKASATGLSSSSEKAKNSTNQFGKATDATERQVAELRRMIAATTKELDALRLAQNTTKKNTDDLGNTNKVAAGQVGNLTAQFNDIGVMLAAGQNPLQLAIQQGTQITQVIGPMGAAGAVKSLGSALKAMVSPVSLLTLGVIAGGAALFQWATGAMSAADGAGTFTEKLDEATGQVQTYIDLINSQDDSFSARFESAKGQIEATSEAYRDLIALAKIDALQNIDSLTQGLASSVLDASYLQGEIGDTGDLLGIETQLQGNITVWKANRDAVRDFVDELKRLESAADLDAQYQSAIALRETFKSTVDTSGEMTAEQIEFWRNLSLSIQQMELLGAATDNVSTAANGTVRSVDLITNAALGALAKVDAIDAGFRNVAATQTTLTAETQTYIAKMADAFTSAQELKAELGLAAFEALRLSGVDVTSPISSAAQAAAVLAANLGISLNAALSLQNLQSSLTYSGRGQNPNNFGDPFKRDPNESSGTISPQAQALIDRAKAAAARTGRSGGGARGGATSKLEQERKATQDLIDSLNQELAILRESDPIRQEMLRNRDALAGATAEERAQIEQLITAREAEQLAAEQQREAWESFRTITYDTFTDLVTSGKSFGDVLTDLTAKIADMALQGLLLGEGPLGGIFGGSSGGGLLGDIFGSIFPGSSLPAAATGGMIYGKGGGKSDDVLMWGSTGEYMINAEATAKNRHLLERINAGEVIPAFASGGAVDGSVVGTHGTSGAGDMNVTMDLRGARGNQEITESARLGMEQALKEYDRNVLPRRVATIKDDPRRIG
ncbi:phage tail length tape measure family protein [Ascidiaceihabitans sp.]|uniref:phage tail length tape measure family protein n=1 Tax=Ascidiaceihabitans sp. TaxID=1872644 RepID=UPI0032985C08